MSPGAIKRRPAAAAEASHGAVGGIPSGVRSKKLRLGSKKFRFGNRARFGCRGVFGGSSLIHQSVGGQPVHLDGGEMLLHELMLADRFAMLLAFLGVTDGF